MSRNPWRVGTREIVLMAIGAVIYTVLSYITKFIPVGGVELRPAQAVLTFFGFAFGPLVGLVAGTLGNVIKDLIAGDGFWWNWSLGNGVVGFICGLWYLRRDYTQPGALSITDYVALTVFSVVGNFAGLYGAGAIDVLMGQPWEVVFGTWALPAALTNSIFAVVLTPVILIAWRSRQASQTLGG